MAQEDALPVLAALAVVGVFALVSFVLRTLLAPWVLLRRLRAQGIPGYGFRPLLGNVPELARIEARRRQDPAFAAQTHASQFLFDGTKKFGKVWTWSLGSKPRVVLADPALVRQVLVSKADKFKKPEEIRLLSLLGNGLASSEGALWARQRQLLTPAFHFVELRRLFVVMAKCTAESVKEWDATTRGSPEQPLHMDAELCGLTLKIIATTAFGAHFEEGDRRVVKEMQNAFTEYNSSAQEFIPLAMMTPLYSLVPSKVNRRKTSSEAILRKRMKEIIAERKSLGLKAVGEHAVVDLLQLMLDARGEVDGDAASQGGGMSKSELDQDKEGSAPMSEQQLMDECMTFLFAGHETTAVLMTWTMMLLSQHSEWQDKAREEVMRIRGERVKDWVPSFDELAELKIVTCILNETLRLFPPASAIVRGAKEEVVLGDNLVVPAGCTVTIPIQVIHLEQEYWGKDAQEFNPQRFADGISNAASVPGAFIPFSAGPRVCIGQNFAMIEAKLILALLLTTFEWRVAPEYKHCPASVLTMRARHGLPVILTRI